jgi:hypothetical protein
MMVTKYLRKFIRLNEKILIETVSLLKLSGESNMGCWPIHFLVAEPEVSAPVMPNPTPGYATETPASTSHC